MEAILSLPATRPVFDSIVPPSAFDPSIVTPELIVETMAVPEWVGAQQETLALLSSLTDVELMAYFRDLYRRLIDLTDPGSNER